MSEYNITTSLFINHVYYWGDPHRDIFLGPESAKNLNPLASVINHDILFTLHSDCPITPISPFFSIWTAVNRITKDEEILGEEQRISVEEALKSMTIYGAQLNSTEDFNGSIEENKIADFIIVDKNPWKAQPVDIKDIKIIKTIIGGEIVYDRNN
ncbi:amidohydrolase family protein [Halobacillus shinanisalinarum]|uniref:Amidohydrolase family protein n=2 Tax=Halobacillus shinanisalinarum TaxID=2932258 RepID=A0ABY4H3L7_9BACI|nr:amidohydrolase family protein [Halobacillus shinanisalinarum]